MGSSNATRRMLISSAIIFSLIYCCGTKEKSSAIGSQELTLSEDNESLLRNIKKRSPYLEVEDLNTGITKYRPKRRSRKWKCGRKKMKKYCCRNCLDFKKNRRKRRDCHLCHYKTCNRIVTVLRTYRCGAKG